MNEIQMKKVSAGHYKSDGGKYQIHHHVELDNRWRKESVWYLYISEHLVGRYRTMKDALAGMENYRRDNEMTMDEKMSIFTDEELLKVFEKASERFDPLDDASCEMYEAAKAEILKRMKA